MPIYNIGSINIDQVFAVEHIAQSGETVQARSTRRYLGGKGANQSVALARAGATVLHIGCIGADDTWLIASLAEAGVEVAHILRADLPTGHAAIQVAATGENAIVVCGGANLALESVHVEQALITAGRGDTLLIQNEVNHVGTWVDLARKRGLSVWLNPAPMTPDLRELPIKHLAGLVMNETEACALAEVDDIGQAWDRLVARAGRATVVLTRGAAGAVMHHRGKRYEAQPPKVDAVDTTAAGDTFIGFLLAALHEGAKPQAALNRACHAAALSVTQAGAARSIPTLAQVRERCPDLA